MANMVENKVQIIIVEGDKIISNKFVRPNLIRYHIPNANVSGFNLSRKVENMSTNEYRYIGNFTYGTNGCGYPNMFNEEIERVCNMYHAKQITVTCFKRYHKNESLIVDFIRFWC